MNRSQHVVGSGLVFAVGILVTWISFTQQPAQAFLFPRLIATVFVVLAGWTFGKAVMGLSKVGNGVSAAMFLNMLPGLIVMVVYLFWGAGALGFYTATALAFFVLLSIYDPAPHDEPRTWVSRAVITAGFVAVMYGLFSELLNVYTPKEILF
ncbi:tripartite tricarboxylate transporter TctB family protein [Paracoccus homiensis]|uniref:Tripartite tricarboxylate transporter TctB family protein n=1 Tax=Paracoccus homiensis TaxID=364199 RepID=A0A1I0HFZ4_9RHOB|nr:tripartite tricarboxylate transporter TctB family protein [Paracoccus homiensis]SET82716.1 Tripartite tricarboxylate transporter TctB family protein [Paracoccus homiensis]